MPFDWLKKWLSTARFPRGRNTSTKLEVTSEGFLFRELDDYLLIRWEDIERIFAVRHEGYIGNTFSLCFETNDKKHFQLSEDNTAWSLVKSSLDLYLPSTIKEANWNLMLMTSENEIIEIYHI